MIDLKVWHNEDMEVKKDDNSGTIITATFDEPSAEILLLGWNERSKFRKHLTSLL